MDISELISHYQALFDQHGPSSRAVQWADKVSQEKRFAILCEIADEFGSVIDFGCGLSHMYQYLRSIGNPCEYLGVDIVPEFIDYSQKLLASDLSAEAKLIKSGEKLPNGYDFVFVSGVFNNLMDDNWVFMKNILYQIFEVAEKGIAFNALTTYVDYFDKNLFYVDPMKVIEFCKSELNGHVLLRHDYSVKPNGFPYEFTVYVYKKATF